MDPKGIFVGLGIMSIGAIIMYYAGGDTWLAIMEEIDDGNLLMLFGVAALIGGAIVMFYQIFKQEENGREK